MLEGKWTPSAGIDIQRYGFFRFMLPQEETGRDDIEITVDYGVDGETVVANVWARIEKTMVKGFVYTEYVPRIENGEDQCRLIVSAINRNPLFEQHLQAYLVWVRKNLEAEKNG
ncbi:MAG: hypothetical protein K2O18_10695 [Oscillospiraceae bacterium]|nr:hypothetical protein [Oscillospiraceae bacterium]